MKNEQPTEEKKMIAAEVSDPLYNHMSLYSYRHGITKSQMIRDAMMYWLSSASSKSILKDITQDAEREWNRIKSTLPGGNTDKAWEEFMTSLINDLASRKVCNEHIATITQAIKK